MQEAQGKLQCSGSSEASLYKVVQGSPCGNLAKTFKNLGTKSGDSHSNCSFQVVWILASPSNCRIF